MIEGAKTKCQIILDWFTKNKLKANPYKSQYIIYGTRQQLAKISPGSKTILIQDTLIKAIPTVKNLVMKFDQNLTWNKHITDLKRSRGGKLTQISILRGSMTKEALRNLVSATETSRPTSKQARTFRSTTKKLREACRFKNDPNGRIINLSRHTFSLHVFSLLDKGLNFCPRPLRFNTTAFDKDLKAFFRHIRLEAHFGISECNPTILQQLNKKEIIYTEKGRQYHRDI